jgi:hypothetical protein
MTRTMRLLTHTANHHCHELQNSMSSSGDACLLQCKHQVGEVQCVGCRRQKIFTRWSGMGELVHFKDAELYTWLLNGFYLPCLQRGTVKPGRHSCSECCTTGPKPLQRTTSHLLCRSGNYTIHTARKTVGSASTALLVRVLYFRQRLWHTNAFEPTSLRCQRSLKCVMHVHAA